MKFFVGIGIFALAALAYTQPLVDMVQQNSRPFPPVKKPLQPPILRPSAQVDETQPPVFIVEDNHLKPAVEVVEEIVQNIVNVIKHKPDIEYYNGKVVPTPKYPTGPKME